MLRTALACFLIVLSTTPGVVAAPPSQPAAPQRPVTDTYWGVDVVDNYQYLEQVDEAEVLEWANAQNAYTRHWLDSTPQRQLILDRIVELRHNVSPRYYAL